MTTITVAIPVHNSEHCIRETLDSVLAQTYPAHEILVVDDGSTDATADIVRSFGPRVRYLYQKNEGAAAARNNAIQNATGDWIAFLDHDDIFLPEKLDKQRRIIESNPNLVVVYSAFTFLYLDGTTRVSPAFPAKYLWPALRYRTPILPSTSVVRRTALLEIGGFRTAPLVRRVEDWDMWVRLIRRYSSAAFQELPESLLLYRVLPNSESSSFLPMAANTLYMLETLLIADLDGKQRGLWRRRFHARLYYNLSIKLREQHNDRYWEFALESMLQWPFFGKIVPFYRYRVFAHMLYTRIRNFRFSFRYWWPVRRCHADLR
jgi:glycosyltransferase involved in cell wall biosynthesis